MVWLAWRGEMEGELGLGVVNGEEGRPVRGEILCSLLKNEQQKQRQFHGDAEGGAREASGAGEAAVAPGT